MLTRHAAFRCVSFTIGRSQTQFTSGGASGLPVGPPLYSQTRVFASPTGCATSFLSAVMKLERMLRGFLVFEMPEVFSTPCQQKAGALNGLVKTPQHKNASRCATRGFLHTLGEARGPFHTSRQRVLHA
jgi:hypothetical protein